MEERNISPEESLQIIQRMIEKSRIKASENGFYLMVWAVTIIVASILQYLSIVYRFYLNGSLLLWISAAALAFAISGIYTFSRHKKTRIERNKVDRVVHFIWISFGVSAALVWILAYRYHINNVTQMILISLGAATFISGIVLEFKPLIRGGIIFWAACVVCFFVSDAASLLVNALAMFLGFLIPGIILWKKYKAERNV